MKRIQRIELQLRKLRGLKQRECNQWKEEICLITVRSYIWFETNRSTIISPRSKVL